jgi:hypothetical protein
VELALIDSFNWPEMTLKNRHAECHSLLSKCSLLLHHHVVNVEMATTVVDWLKKMNAPPTPTS